MTKTVGNMVDNMVDTVDIINFLILWYEGSPNFRQAKNIFDIDFAPIE